MWIKEINGEKVLSKNKKSDYTYRTMYKDYVSVHQAPASSKFFPTYNPIVSYSIYKAVLIRFFALVIDDILTKAVSFKMPLSLGSISVTKNKMPISYLRSQNNLKIDYGYFNKTGKRRFHLNEHRNYYRYKITWDKTKKPYIIEYSFKPVRAFKRRLAHLLLTNDSIDFFEK